MSDDNGKLSIEVSEPRDGRFRVTASHGGKVLHEDRMDVSSAVARKRFSIALVAAAPVLKQSEIESELLTFLNDKRHEPIADAGELDVSCIARPELGHHRAVSWILIPTVRMSGGRPSGVWRQYLRWHDDGRREVRDLDAAIVLPDGDRIWVHPQPAAPEPTMRPDWSAEARRRWTAGSETPNPADLWRRVLEQITHFLEFDPNEGPGLSAVLSLWVFLTYVFRGAWSSVPYLSIAGPLGSGKSVVLQVLARLVFRPIESSNVTAPLLFRSLHERGGTLLLDEAERLRDSKSPDAGELRSILLSGYKAGSPAMRLEKQGDTFRSVAFQCYGPKAVGSIAALPEALQSRCIRVGMFRAAPGSPIPRRRLDADPGEWQSLRDDLHAVTLEYGPTWLDLAAQSDAAPSELNGREFELWQPLLALAGWVESHGAENLTELVRSYALESTTSAADQAVPDGDELLLRLLAHHVVNATHGTLKAGDLLKSAREEDPTSFDSWSAKGVANALRRYGIQTKKGRGNAGRTYRHVTAGSLTRIEQAYGFSLDVSPDNVPTCTDTCRPDGDLWP